MKIGLDFDGVIINREELVKKAAEHLYGKSIPVKMLRRETLINSGILTDEEYNELGRKIFETREFYMEPVKEVLDYLPKLLTDGYNIKVVTSRGEIASEIAREWLEQQGIEDIPVISVGRKNNKTEACRSLDIYIDDDLDKLESLASVVPFLFLFSWEYNRHDQTNVSIVRVNSWKDFYKFCQEIEENK